MVNGRVGVFTKVKMFNPMRNLNVLHKDCDVRELVRYIRGLLYILHLIYPIIVPIFLIYLITR